MQFVVYVLVGLGSEDDVGICSEKCVAGLGFFDWRKSVNGSGHESVGVLELVPS